MSWLTKAIGLDAVENGLKEGLQYDLEFLALVKQAFETKDLALAAKLLPIIEQHISELSVEEQLIVKGDIVGQLKNGADPFSTSRHMLQQVINEYNPSSTVASG